MTQSTKTSTITPFQYQIDVANELSQFSGRLIADERGCGKTIEALLLDQLTRDECKGEKGKIAKTLIICPKTVLGVWEREIVRFGVGLEGVSVLRMCVRESHSKRDFSQT